MINSGKPSAVPATVTFQGAIADALGHIGQINLLRGLAVKREDLAGMLFARHLRRFYVLRDNDAAGLKALERLRERADGILQLEPAIRAGLAAGPRTSRREFLVKCS